MVPNAPNSDPIRAAVTDPNAAAIACAGLMFSLPRDSPAAASASLTARPPARAGPQSASTLPPARH
jgi:hypothetical protein